MIYIKTSKENSDVKELLAELIPTTDEKQIKEVIKESGSYGFESTQYYFLDTIKVNSKSKNKISVNLPTVLQTFSYYEEPKELTIVLEKVNGNWQITSDLYSLYFNIAED